MCSSDLDCAIFQRAAAEEIKECSHATLLVGGTAKPFLQNGLINAGRRDRSAQTDDDNYCEGKKNSAPQLRDFY